MVGGGVLFGFGLVYLAVFREKESAILCRFNGERKVSGV